MNDLRSVAMAFGRVLHVASRPDFAYSAGPRILAAKYRPAFPNLVLTVQGVDMDIDRITVRWSLLGASLGPSRGWHRQVGGAKKAGPLSSASPAAK